MNTATKNKRTTIPFFKSMMAKKATIYNPKKERVIVERKDNINSYICGGVYKNISQNIMAKYIGNSDVIGLILSLPFIDWIIEKKILKFNNLFTFLGVERYESTYLKMKSVIKKEKQQKTFTAYHGQISDKIYNVKPNTYAHLILDYCGHLSTYMDEIIYAFNNNIIKKNGYIMITIGKTIRANTGIHKTVKDKGRFDFGFKNDTRTICEKSLERTICEMLPNDKSYEIVKMYQYSDDKEKNEVITRGADMVLIVIQRIK